MWSHIVALVLAGPLRAFASQFPIQLGGATSPEQFDRHGASTANKAEFLDNLIAEMTVEDLGQ